MIQAFFTTLRNLGHRRQPATAKANVRTVAEKVLSISAVSPAGHNRPGTQRFDRTSSIYAFGRALAGFILFVFTAQIAVAFNIDSTATLRYLTGGSTITVNSNTVTVTVTSAVSTPSQIEFLRFAATGSPVSMQPTDYSISATTGGAFNPLASPSPYTGAPVLNLALPVQLSPTVNFHVNDAIFIRLTDLDQNAGATLIESILVTVTSSTGDKEVLRLYESGPNTGIFVGYVPSAPASSTPVNFGDGKLSIDVETTITATYTDFDDSSDSSTSAGLFDPIGTVFDSTTGLPVDGVTITIIDMTTGLPAQVLGDDGSVFQPVPGDPTKSTATVISGGTATDANGNLYTFPSGGYRFPLMAVGTYRLVISPPAGWTAPSTVPTSQLAPPPAGSPAWAILEPGSRGEAFSLAPIPVVRIDIPVDPIATGLWMSKETAKQVVSIGDFLPYRLSLQNLSNTGSVPGVFVVDHLPRGFRYRNGSARIDGVLAANPTVAVDGRTLTFNVGTIAPLQAVTISYVVEVAVGAVPGEAINSAYARGPGSMVSNTASATVKVTEDLFHSKSVIVGQVLDSCSAAAKGVPGVRIYLEDGTFVLTDKDGLYHFEGIRPIAHVVQLDTVTLPKGYVPAPCEDNTRFAGRNFSQFVETQGGTLWRADFYVEQPAPATGEELQTDITEVGTGTASRGLTALTLTSTITDRRVRYRIEIGNQTVAIKDLRLAVKLPVALSPILGTTVIDEVPAPDPALSGEDYIFGLSDLAAGTSHVVTFDADIPAGASGEMVTTAVLGFNTIALKDQKTPDAVNRFTVTRTTNYDYKDFVLTTHFDFGLATLKEIDATALADFAETINAWKIDRVELIGHTDSVRLSKKTARLFKDNLGLSRARAATIANALTALTNISTDKITSTGRGELEPIADNRRASGRAANRRVEIKVYLSKQRIDSSVEPVQMDSGPQNVETNASIMRLTGADELAEPAVRIAEISTSSPPVEKKFGILTPLDGTVFVSSINAVRIKLDSRLRPILTLDGNEISNDRIGFTMVDKASKTTLYSYIGIDLGAAGEHGLTIRGVDPFGNTRFEESVTIVRSGAIESIRLLAEGENVADGKTPVRLRLEIRDAAGEIIPAGLSLTLKGGNLLPPRSEASLEQANLKGDTTVAVDRDGWVDFRPVTQSGRYHASLVYGEQLEVAVETYVKPELRDWILVGIAEGTVGYNTVSGNMVSFADEELEEAYYDDGRIAFFAKGKIKGDWLLTAAYDTARPKEEKLHGTIDPDAYYTLYGDGSDQQYDAPSARKLYVKLERNQFYALFGDYDTGLTVTELARYSRSFNGFKSEYQGSRFGYTAFASETNQAFVRDEIPGDGTSGLYRLSRKDLLINSEKIVIETRDRFHSETVVDSRSLSRHLDYDIDYDAGTLYFKEPVFSRDQNFNPVFIVVDYEAADDRDLALNYGGRAALRAGKALEVGVSHLHEGTTGAEGNLSAVDTTLQLGRTKLRGEIATSKVESSTAPATTGDAYLAELSHQGDQLDGRVYIREQESGFGLGQQRSSEAGSRKIGSDARVRLSNRLTVAGEISRQSMLDSGAERDLGQAEVSYRGEDYTLRAGLRQATDTTASGEINRSTQILAGGTWQASRRLNLRLTHEQAILNEDASADYPTRTLLGADYQLTSKVAAFVEQEFTRSDAEETDMTRAGLKATPWTGAQLQSTVTQQGTEYGPRVFATTGLKQSWQIDELWSADAGLDRSQTLRHPGSTSINSAATAASGGGEDFTAVSLGANRKAARWTLSNRIEFRTSDSEDKLGLYSGAEGEVRRGLALSGRFQLFDSRGTAGARSLDGNLRLGLAYRPIQTRWIILDRLDYLFDREVSATSRFDNWRLVNNLNANWRPNRQTQISLQYGAKYVQETIDGQEFHSYTDLPGIEGRYDLSSKWDVGLRASALHSWSSHQIDYSAGPSVGYRVMKNAWLSVGYNLTGFHDEDFSAANFTAQGPYVKFRFKFDQNSVREALKGF